MKLKKEDGFLQIFAYLLIFAIFAFTVYACLDVLGIIEVPDEYSVSKWLSEYSNRETTYDETDNESNDEIDDEDVIENISKKIKIKIENKTNELSEIDSFDISQINNYSNVEYVTSNTEKNEEFLYYYQLDDYAKIIYQEMEKNLDNMKSGKYNISFGKTFNDLLHQDDGEETLNNSFQLAINALGFDKPDLFYIDISKVYLLTRITTKLFSTTYEVEIGAKEGQSYLNSSFNSREDVENAISKLENEKSKVLLRLGGDEEDKIKIVHDYLIDNLEYDSTLSKDNIYNIYGALINKETVCEGYARAFKYILDDINIPCIIACGTAVNSNRETESHAWNYVQLNGIWYAVDVTWDDPVIVGNGYVNSSVYSKYYLKGSREFFTNHYESGDIVNGSTFKYPTLSETNY